MWEVTASSWIPGKPIKPVNPFVIQPEENGSTGQMQKPVQRLLQVHKQRCIAGPTSRNHGKGLGMRRGQARTQEGAFVSGVPVWIKPAIAIVNKSKPQGAQWTCELCAQQPRCLQQVDTLACRSDSSFSSCT